jgi:hypothetical protein
MGMGDLDDLRRLLDGDVDAEGLANNPTLASIAERVYGINIEPMKISKPSQMSVEASVSSNVSSSVVELSTDPLDLMVEVVEGNFPPHAAGSPSMGLPGLIPPAPGQMSGGVEGRNSGFGKIRMGVLSILMLEILNLFGVFGTLFGSVCSSGICPDVGRTRINLLSIGDIGSGIGWSEPLQAGSIGIPDIVAIIGLLAIFVIMTKRK